MKIKKMFIIVLLCLMMCSCSFEEDFSDSYSYTTIYPIEYATKMLYGDNSKVASVYPTSAKADFVVTNKKKEKYSNGEIFVYSGVANEAVLAKDLLNLNSNIKIIDATQGMHLNYSLEEVWLDPSNYLMLCSNIKRSLINYNDNVYTKDAIEDNYKILNEKISELDVELYSIGKSGNYNTILTTNDVLTFLSKYNINVISIDKDKDSLDKPFAEAQKLISNNKIDYIYILEGEILTEAQEKFITENKLVKVTINSLYTLTEENVEEEKNYITLMNEIIDQYKKELYKN